MDTLNDRPTDSNSAMHIRRALADIKANAQHLQPETIQQVTLALQMQLRQLANTTEFKEDEMRLVTVMFIDVVGSTSIAESLNDDEMWRALIAATHKQFVSVLKQWDGEVGQYLGDGLLCYFGAIHSQGNEALRAVSCAVAAQEMMTKFSQVVEQTYGVENFRTRIGISTGLSVVGPIGQQGNEQILAMGTPTNLAARLQNIAPPGGIVIDTETYSQVGAEFKVTAKTPTKLNGLEEPVTYYLVHAQRQQTTTQLTLDRIEGIKIPFVGRQSIYQKILLEVQHVRDNGGFRAVTIYGENGLGKSRLLQEIVHKTITEKFAIARMVAHYERRDAAFGLLRDMLATVCGLSLLSERAEIEKQIVECIKTYMDSEDAEEMGVVLGYLAGYGFEGSDYATALHKSEINRENALAFRWMARWLLSYAKEKPLLIVVDNLQWADKQSIDMLNFMSHFDLPLVILGASRSPLPADMLYLPEQPHLELNLKPLDRKETRRLLASMLKQVDNVPPELPELISERSEGNPLYIEEFLRMQFNDNIFEQTEDGRWQVNQFQYKKSQMRKHQLPNGLRGIFQARLDSLSPEIRRVVQIASCIGQTFWAGCISYVVDFDTVDIMDELIARDIIVQPSHSQLDRSDEYQFRNSLYFEAAYNILLRSQRVEHHAKIARWLKKNAKQNEQVLGLLAFQHKEASQPTQALKTYVKAAEYKLSRGLLSDAQGLIADGLATSRDVPREEALPSVIRLWLLRAQVAYMHRRYGEAKADSQSTLRLLEEIPFNQMREERVTANVTLGDAHISLGSYENARDALTEALFHVDVKRNPLQTATVQRSFGLLFWARGELDQADMYLRNAFATTTEGGNQRELTSVMSMLGQIALDKGDFAGALDYVERTLESNERNRNVLYQIADMRLMGVIYRLLFAYDMALDMIEKAEAISTKINYPDPLLQVNRGMCEIALEDGETGLKRLQQAMEQNYDDRYEHHIVWLSYLRGLVQLGQVNKGAEVALGFLEDVGKENRVLYGRGLLWYGLAQHKQGDHAALESLLQALEYETNYGGQALWLCHYALGIAHPDLDQALYYHERALQMQQAIATSLYRRPALMSAVSDSDRIAGVFKHLAGR